MDTEDKATRGSTEELVDRRNPVSTLMVSSEMLDGLERALSATPAQRFCTRGSSDRPGEGLLEQLGTGGCVNSMSGGHLGGVLGDGIGHGCQDVQAAIQTHSNTGALTGLLARMLVDVSVPGAVQRGDLAEMTRVVQLAPDTFSADLAGAPAKV